MSFTSRPQGVENGELVLTGKRARTKLRPEFAVLAVGMLESETRDLFWYGRVFLSRDVSTE
jgi:hypothetical protein